MLSESEAFLTCSELTLIGRLAGDPYNVWVYDHTMVHVWMLLFAFEDGSPDSTPVPLFRLGCRLMVSL